MRYTYISCSKCGHDIYIPLEYNKDKYVVKCPECSHINIILTTLQ